MSYIQVSKLEPLCEKTIQQHLTNVPATLLTKLVILDSVDSTNSYLKQQLDMGANPGTVVLAEQQTAGRGQPGRMWHSPAGTNIYLSALWRFEQYPDGLSLACGVAIIQALQTYGILSGLTLKKPNDVLWQGQKLAGILCENFPGKDGKHNVIVGVGLNTQMPDSAPIDQAWTDIEKITRAKPQRNLIASLIINTLLPEFARFARHGSQDILNTWESFLQ